MKKTTGVYCPFTVIPTPNDSATWENAISGKGIK